MAAISACGRYDNRLAGAQPAQTERTLMSETKPSPKGEEDKKPKPLGPTIVTGSNKPIIRPKIESRGR